MLKPAWHPNFQENQLCRRLWVSDNLERKQEHWGEKEMRQVPLGMGWGQLQAQIRVQERCEMKHWEEAVFLPIHDMT